MNAPTAPFALIPPTWHCELHGDYATRINGGIQPQTVCPSCAREQNQRREDWRAAWRLHKRWLAAGIPDRFLNRSFENYRPSAANKRAAAIARSYAQRFEDQFAQGIGVLLTGDLGTGKSHLAVATLTEVIRSGRDGAFVSASEYLAARKPSYAGSITNVEKFAKVDLVVFDDVGAKRYTDYEVGALADVLHCRYDARLPTIVTTNAADLAAFIGDRAVDRFAEAMLTARLVGESYRSKVPDDDALRVARLAIPEPLRVFEARVCSSGVLVTKRYEQTLAGEEKVA